MTLRVEIGQALRLSIAACLLTAFAGVADAQLQKPRSFSRDDYEMYFNPGRFATYSPFYQSDGVMDVVGAKVTRAAGRYLLRQSTKSFDVSPNYDIDSGFPFYKIQTQHTEHMVWDARQGLYRYDYTASEFGADTARVWESNDRQISVSTGDKERGDLHRFYRDADRRAGQDPKKMEDDFKATIIGPWTWACAFIRDDRFEVECQARHLGSQHVETFFYRRLDELTS